MTKAEIQQAFSKGNISLETAFWTAGMLQTQPLWSIRELRWLVFGRAGERTAACCRLSLGFLPSRGFV